MTGSKGDIWGGAPQRLRRALLAVQEGGVDLFLVGGTVRDWLLGRPAADLDLACSISARETAARLRRELGGGTVVDLSGEAGEEAVRLVWRGFQVDLASFRYGVATVQEDLRRRDFTVNAIAVPLGSLVAGGTAQLLDPAGGVADLRRGLLRHLPGAFADDPLRLLRGYRFVATLGFTLDKATREAVSAGAAAITGVSAERVTFELRGIFLSSATSATLRLMDEDRLLPQLLPELYHGRGIDQPGFHHLDVLGHSFLALARMEEILARPSSFYPGHGERLSRYLADGEAALRLKWAALFHDLGKPATRRLPEDGAGRVTFYRHDSEGERIFCLFAERSRWSREQTSAVARLIAMHMHPFHLCNVGRSAAVSARAILKLCRRAGELLDGLFLLAMADSLASLGAEKPPHMEEELRQLLGRVRELYEERIDEALHGPPLVNGRDLIDHFGLTPGPLFAELLDQVTAARVEGVVGDRASALAYVAELLAARGAGETATGFRLVKESQME